MDLKKIKEMMAMMGKANARKIRIKEKDFEIELEMEGAHGEPIIMQAAPHRPQPQQHKIAADIPQSIDHIQPKVEAKVGNYVTSPMVGTYYATPSPDDPPFVKVGDKVTPQTVVCIIEAMKVMNEVKANMTGTISEILVENSHPVEFGTKLFLIS